VVTISSFKFVALGFAFVHACMRVLVCICVYVYEFVFVCF